MSLKPRSILDLGFGWGKYLLLAREYTDIWEGRINPEDWQVRIDGVEGFKPYLNGWQEKIATNIYNMEITEFLEKNTFKYDLILLIDVLEHFYMGEGKVVIEAIKANSKNFLVTTPIQVLMQNAVNDNVLEVHRTQWSADELSKYGELYKTSRSFILLG